MSLVVAKKTSKGFQVAADTGVFVGDYLCSNKVHKIAITPWGVVGSTGYEAPGQMFNEYCQNHEPAGTTLADFGKFVKDFEEWFVANSPHVNKHVDSGHAHQEYIICYKDKIYCSDDCNRFDFACIGQQCAAEILMKAFPDMSALEVCTKAVESTVFTSKPIDYVDFELGKRNVIKQII